MTSASFTDVLNDLVGVALKDVHSIVLHEDRQTVSCYLDLVGGEERLVSFELDRPVEPRQFDPAPYALAIIDAAQRRVQ